MKKNKLIIIILIVSMISISFAFYQVKNIEKQYRGLFFRAFDIYDEFNSYTDTLKYNLDIPHQLIALAEIKSDIQSSRNSYILVKSIRKLDKDKYLLGFISSFEVYISALEEAYISNDMSNIDIDKVKLDLTQASHVIHDISATEKNYANELHSIMLQRYEEYPNNDIFKIYFGFINGKEINVSEFRVPYKKN